jgi:AcrR family transcriptional regulator
MHVFNMIKKLGVSMGALYQYYNGKEELLLDVMRARTDLKRSKLVH